MKRYEFYRSLDELLHDLLLRAPNGKDAAHVAETIGKDYFTLVKELLPSNPGHKFGTRDLVPLMLACGSDAPVAYLAARMGGVYVSCPTPGTDLTDAGRAAVQAAAEFGDVMRAFRDATARDSEDGEGLSERELARLVREASEAQAAIAEFLAVVKGEFRSRTGHDPDDLFGGEDRR
ncbi:MAG: phage regulatory CII family protein [Desulfovibrio sp.]